MFDGNVSSEPAIRHWSKESIVTLTKRFSLANRENMQDWAYEVANPKRLLEFFNVLTEYKHESDVRFTLMDVILQSLEESEIDLFDSPIAQEIESYLKQNYSMHEYQVWYWSAFDTELNDAFRISSLLRKIWSEAN